MKYDDLQKLKGAIKDSVSSWVDDKIEALFPNQVYTRTFLKRGFTNWISREDVRVNKYLDTVFLFLSSDGSTIDSDAMVDLLLDMFGEMKRSTYQTGFADIEIGGGEVVVRLPHNLFIDMLTGGTDTVKFGRADFEELKDLLNIEN